jgi:C-terminal processing protease CtpA/Prc
MTVDKVSKGSDAEAKGLSTLAEILSIDGRDVQEFTASFLKGSDLNRKLMDRKPGERIRLGVLLLGGRSPKVITLTQGAASLSGSLHDPNADAMAPNAVHIGIR